MLSSYASDASPLPVLSFPVLSSNNSAAQTHGYSSAAQTHGDESIAVSTGIQGKASGILGNWLVLAEWEDKDGQWAIKSVKTVKVDGDKIKPDTLYMLKDGEFVETN